VGCAGDYADAEFQLGMMYYRGVNLEDVIKANILAKEGI